MRVKLEKDSQCPETVNGQMMASNEHVKTSYKLSDELGAQKSKR